MLNKIKEMSDIPKEYREFAEVIGLDAFIRLVRYMGGCLVYVPLESCVTRAVRNRLIRKAFNGDYKAVAKTYRMSEGHIRRIIDKGE